MCAYIWLISMGFHVGIYIYGTRQPWMRHGWLSFEVYSFNVLEKTIPERRFCRDLDFFLFFFPRYYHWNKLQSLPPWMIRKVWTSEGWLLVARPEEHELLIYPD